jgi:thiamine-phosphate pyrophosphorylase
MNGDFPPLYAIMSAELLSAPDLENVEDFVAMLASAGVGIIQYRSKYAASRTLFEVSSRISRALAGNSVRFIVNDRPDVARLSGADGVHVGQEDLPVDDARKVCHEAVAHRPGGPENFWVGVSTHTLEQVRHAATTSADYIALGPIFPTTTKERPDAIVGTDFIRQARQLTTKPLVAIGGITVSSAAEVFRAGADCVAVARDLICAPDPAARAAEYLAIAKSFRLGLL